MYTILTIDDDTKYRTDIMQILEFENYVALGAKDGLRGLQMIRQYLPDLILCDVDMPSMNGIELLRTVKSEPMLAKIPFIVMSGRNDAFIIQTAHALGAAIYLTKPISIATFLVTIIDFLPETDSV